MAKQSTRHRYKSRREKNAETARVTKLLLLFGGIFLLLILLKNWRSYWAYLETFFYD